MREQVTKTAPMLLLSFTTNSDMKAMMLNGTRTCKRRKVSYCYSSREQFYLLMLYTVVRASSPIRVAFRYPTHGANTPMQASRRQKDQKAPASVFAPASFPKHNPATRSAAARSWGYVMTRLFVMMLKARAPATDTAMKFALMVPYGSSPADVDVGACRKFSAWPQ